MVRFLNAPQTQIQTMEDPTWGALARLAGKIGGRMVENQQLREKSAKENTEQIQKLMQTYIGAGFTPDQSLTMAQQMTGKYKEPDTSRDPWTQLGGLTVPNPINIGQNIWEQLATPKWQAPDYSQMKMPKLRKQMTLEERNFSAPPQYSNLTFDEWKDLATMQNTKSMADYRDKSLDIREKLLDLKASQAQGKKIGMDKIISMALSNLKQNRQYRYEKNPAKKFEMEQQEVAKIRTLLGDGDYMPSAQEMNNTEDGFLDRLGNWILGSRRPQEQLQDRQQILHDVQGQINSLKSGAHLAPQSGVLQEGTVIKNKAGEQFIKRGGQWVKM